MKWKETAALIMNVILMGVLAFVLGHLFIKLIVYLVNEPWNIH